jgi:hypothetical protein
MMIVATIRKKIKASILSVFCWWTKIVADGMTPKPKRSEQVSQQSTVNFFLFFHIASSVKEEQEKKQTYRIRH